MPHIINRMLSYKRYDLTCFGRSKEISSKVEGKSIFVPGRVIFDLHPYLKKEMKQNTSLNSAAFNCIKDKNEELSTLDKFNLLKGSDLDRTRLAKYCMKEATLAYDICSKTHIIRNLLEASRDSGALLQDLISKSSSFKSNFQVCYASRHGAQKGHFICDDYLYSNESNGKENFMPLNKRW